jgi:HK97 family phage prohead protease
VTDVLFRSAGVQTDGRTLSGIAVPFGRAALVSDSGGPPYREVFNRAAFTKSLKERGGMPYPLKLLHAGAPGYPGDPTPLGPTTFRATPSGLEFEARASKTRAADEALELLRDGILGDVSIGFRAFRSKLGKDAEGSFTERLEAAPLELSLAVVGTGQHPGAQVLAVRAHGTTTPADTPHRDALERRLRLLVVP